MDWNKYQINFPKRYLERTYFDEKLEQFLQKSDVKTVLDIGGGKHSIISLKTFEVCILDPYVECDTFEKIDWDSDRKFDLVVARGSINYLSVDEIKKIPKFGKFFLANSFCKAPSNFWTQRQFSTLHGKTGIESFRYNPELKIVEHKLEFENNEKIEHSFYYYSEEQFREMISKVKIEHYGKNSLLLKLGVE